MVDLECEYSKMSWNQAQTRQRNGFLTRHPQSRLLSSFSPPPYNGDYQNQPNAPSSSSSSHGNKLSPAILFIIIILAVVFFVSGILHLLARFLTKHRSSSVSESNRYPESGVLQRQLQQLFHLHDSGLDQAFIDALPVFLYKEIRGLNEPFDCPVCLCEFSEKDHLRLLPLCSHAFHIDCIDTWLLSNSTCPLCRGSLYTPGIAIENPIFDFDNPREEDCFAGNGENRVLSGQKSAENDFEKRVFSVRLGKFKSTTSTTNDGAEEGKGVERIGGETSSSNLDARRCFSMGSYQYVVADLELQVAAMRPKRPGGGHSMRFVKGRVGQNGNSNIDADAEGKKIASKGESFSVSKIWLWPRKDKFPSSSETQMATSSVTVGMPWSDKSQVT